jgi:hypothetical protein
VDELGTVEQILFELVAHEGGPTPAQLCQACVQVLDVDGLSLAMISGRTVRETLCAQGPDALKIDQLQFALDEGPCLEAYSQGRPVLVPDLDRDRAERWPVFAGAVTETAPHLRAIFGFPLLLGPYGIGAMNLYRDRTGDLAAEEVREAERACALAVPLILDRLAAEPDSGLADYFQRHTVIDRTVVHNATMADHGLAEEDAFARLRAFAFAQERPIEDIAADLMNHRLRLPKDFDTAD